MRWMRSIAWIPTTLSGVRDKGWSMLTCILMHFLAGNMYIQTVCNAECTNYPPCIKIADETQKAITENIWLTSCLLFQHFSHIHQEKKKGKKIYILLGKASIILFCLTCLWDMFAYNFFELQRHVGCLLVKAPVYLILIIANTHYSHYLPVFNSRKLLCSRAKKNQRLQQSPFFPSWTVPDTQLPQIRPRASNRLFMAHVFNCWLPRTSSCTLSLVKKTFTTSYDISATIIQK